MTILRNALGSAALLAAVVSVSAPADAATYKLRIGAGHPAGALWISTIKDFFIPQVTQRVKQQTGDVIEWTEAWGGSVCKLGECLKAVETGLLDLADIETAFEPARLMAHNFTFFVPFGAGDARAVQKAAAEVYEKVPALGKVLEDKYSQRVLGAGVVGNYGLVTTFKWDKVEELKGKKIAAAGPNIPWLQASGVVGVQSTLNDAYTSFQTGVYEGWVMFPDALVSFKLNEVTKQYVDMDFGAQHTPLLTINKDTFAGLPAPVQKIFLDVGKEWGAHLAKLVHEKNEEGRKLLKDRGLDVKQADIAVKQAWAKSLPNIPKQRAEEIKKAGQPGEVVYSYVDALKAAGVTLPRDWSAER